MCQCSDPLPPPHIPAFCHCYTRSQHAVNLYSYSVFQIMIDCLSWDTSSTLTVPVSSCLANTVQRPINHTVSGHSWLSVKSGRLFPLTICGTSRDIYADSWVSMLNGCNLYCANSLHMRFFSPGCGFSGFQSGGSEQLGRWDPECCRQRSEWPRDPTCRCAALATAS